MKGPLVILSGDYWHDSFDRWERLYTTIDLLAALFFLIGSVLFYFEALQFSATTLFVIGSALFALRPLLRFLREFHIANAPLPGDGDD